MVSQNAMPLKQHLGGALPYVFTEYGVLQLSNVINSEIATQISIRIRRKEDKDEDEETSFAEASEVEKDKVKSPTSARDDERLYSFS